MVGRSRRRLTSVNQVWSRSADHHLHLVSWAASVGPWVAPQLALTIWVTTPVMVYDMKRPE